MCGVVERTRGFLLLAKKVGWFKQDVCRMQATVQDEQLAVVVGRAFLVVFWIFLFLFVL